MKKTGILSGVLLILFISLACSFVGDEEYKTLEIGSKAPMIDYEMESTSGERMNLKRLKAENGMLVIFSCNTCPFVIAWEDRYPDIADWANAEEVGLALVNSNEAKRDKGDSMEDMRAHAEEKGYPNIPYLLDQNSELANAFGAKTTPHVFLFNQNWELVYEGAIDDNHKSRDAAKQHYLKNALQKLKSGEKIDPKNTKAIGCSIKRVKS